MQKITLNQDNCFLEKIGINGLEAQSFFAWENKIKEILNMLENEIKQGKLVWPTLPFQEEEIKKFYKFARGEGDKWKNIVVLGMGGSALGAIALEQALLSQKKDKPNLIVVDNIDPDFFTTKLAKLDWEKTLILVISKSGQTPETLAQFFILQNLLKEDLGVNYCQHFIVITDDQDNPLRQLAEKEGFLQFTISNQVGGRFSVLSAVGLLPAALSGIDILKLCEGARAMHEECFKTSLAQNPAGRLAVAAYLFDKKKQKRLQIILPYANSLIGLADWYRQLLAESLGKDENTGLTPLTALGATDQHSQLQLWNEGPNDKVITFWELANFQNVIPLPEIENAEFFYLKNKSLNQLIAAEKTATEMTLTQHKRPNQTLVLPRLDEEILGQIFFLYEMQIAILGKFYAVDAYSQPGVEEGKILTKRLLQGR